MNITSPQPPGNNLSYLDGFRGLAAFWVLAAHCAIWGGVVDVWIPNPKVAVDIFMVMSGFLMVYGAIRREASEPPAAAVSWRRFYVRRFWRIAPVYYVALLVTVLLAGPFTHGYAELRTLNPERWATYRFLPTEPTVASLITHVTFVFGVLPRQWSMETGLPDWSLSLEMQYYFAFPFIYLAMRRWGHIRVSVILFGATVVTTHFTKGLFAEPSFLFVKCHLFLIGMLLCESFCRRGVGGARQRSLALAAVGFSLAQLHYYGSDAIVLVMAVAGIIALASPAIATHRPAKALAAILGNRLTHYMAEASYSVYLFHGFFLSIAGAYLYRIPQYAAMSPATRYALLLILVTIGAYSSAAILARLIEQPGIRLGKRLAAKIGSSAVSRRTNLDVPPKDILETQC
jgi:peptidoglycan/LPS O-acetylase OafA/YrhL